MFETYVTNDRHAGQHLDGVRRCPHCSIAGPNLMYLWSDRMDEYGEVGWAAYRCTSCSGVVTVQLENVGDRKLRGFELWPDAKSAHEDIPDPARSFLQQAFETLHAPDAAAMVSGSAVDAMLKAQGYDDGSLYSRIDRALEDNVLTQGMADWAHSVRLGSNRPRHADAERPHVSADEAKQSVEFAEALGSFLFVLTAKINRGIAAAEAAQGAAENVNDMRP